MNSYRINSSTNPYSTNWAASPYTRTTKPTLPTTSFDPFQKNYSKAMSSVFQSFTSLSKVVGNLTDKTDNVLNKRAVDTGDSKFFSATAKQGASIASYQVGVKQIATAQQNTGGLFQSNGTGAFSNGTHSMKLALSDGKSVNVSVNVKSGESNETVLKNMAGAINSSNLGVKAQAVTAKQSDGTTQTRLVVTSAKTGTDAGFKLTDTSGNLAAATGANTVSTTAKNAEYSVNGKSYTSQSNEVTLDDGKVALSLKGATAKLETLRVKSDTQAVTSGVKEFVKAYNETLTTLKSNSGFAINKKWHNELTQQSTRADLSKIGITVNADHTLRVDEAVLTKAASTHFDQVQNALTGPRGLIARVGVQAQKTSASQMAQYFESARPTDSVHVDEYSRYQNMMNFQFSSMNQGNFMNLLA
ncbi:flagellar filament capping protein FliD [Tumebacillus permanentifrigoris]|uniref:Flagellar hook-associated protein 2 n=1 Tax=Tumebacillus permanentifrigoris TaxID=378543 RepID=A0A316DBG6_9BACL|nr:flagellar filament capping protein FliD [Tumebacillus permanentifrigoris]PWK11496.1 flagellar hook-associated protein 2 [Tumebacillus permanentifrigoris]